MAAWEQFLYWSFLSFGITNVVTYGKIGAPVRRFAEWFHPKVGELFHCSMCFGFWVGLVLSLCGISPSHFMDNHVIIKSISDGFVSSASCWILFLIAYRLGAKEL